MHQHPFSSTGGSVTCEDGSTDALADGYGATDSATRYEGATDSEDGSTDALADGYGSTDEDGATDSAPEAPGSGSGCPFGIEPKLQIFGTVPFGFGNLSLAWLRLLWFLYCA